MYCFYVSYSFKFKMIQFKTGILNGITLEPLKHLIMLTAISSHLASLEETGSIPDMKVKYKWPRRLAITGTLAFKSIFKQYFSQALNRVFIYSKAQSVHTAWRWRKMSSVDAPSEFAHRGNWSRLGSLVATANKGGKSAGEGPQSGG